MFPPASRVACSPDPNYTDSDGRASYENVNLGTMNEDRSTVLWSAESDDHGEVVTLQFDTPLDGVVTIDG